MATLYCASSELSRSSRTARYGRMTLLGLAGLTGVTLLFAACLTPVYAQPVKGVKMTQKFKNVSNQAANDFHLETTLFILKSNPPTSDVFKNVKVDAGG